MRQHFQGDANATLCVSKFEGKHCCEECSTQKNSAELKQGPKGENRATR